MFWFSWNRTEFQSKWWVHVQKKFYQIMTWWQNRKKFYGSFVFKLMLSIDGWGISCETAIRWLQQSFTGDKSTLIHVMAWCHQETSHFLSQCWPRSMLPFGINVPQWVNSLWPSDTIWRHKSGSTLAQVKACCLMAPSHYLNQCWLIISKIQWHSFECNFTRGTSAISHWN